MTCKSRGVITTFLILLMSGAVSVSSAIAQTADVPKAISSQSTQVAPATGSDAAAPVNSVSAAQATVPVTSGQAPSATSPAAQAPATAATAPAVVAPSTAAQPAATSTPATIAEPVAQTGEPTSAPAAVAAKKIVPSQPKSVIEQAFQDALDAVQSGLPDAAGAERKHDLSPLGMFMAADPVVKGVMMLLAFMSVMTLSILIAKIIQIPFGKMRVRRSIRRLKDAKSLPLAAEVVRRGEVAGLILEALEEIQRSTELPADGIKERVQAALWRYELKTCRKMSSGLMHLAVVASAGPFIGLFGTVWGIMRSFIGIANSNTTNLAVVAPGIAEALLATGIGLVAAIPAVILYNYLSKYVSSYSLMVGDASSLILRHVSRDLDAAIIARRAASQVQPQPRPQPILQPVPVASLDEKTRSVAGEGA